LPSLSRHRPSPQSGDFDLNPDARIGQSCGNQEPTQLKRLAKLIDDSANGRRIDPMKPTNA